MVNQILIVDDEPGVLDVVAEALEADGHAVTAVSDGLTALDRLAETAFDVVITDLVMPGLSGLDVAESVKRTSPSTAVILLTAWAETAERVRVRESAVDATVAKPFDIDDLRARARSALGKARSSEVGQPAGPRVLLVEDDRIDLNFIAVMLGSANCRVDTARSARHALALATARPYDLILLNCRASEADVSKLSASLRQGAGGRARVPVVVISAGPVLDGTIEKFLDQASQSIVALRAAATAGDNSGLAETARRLRRECTAMGALAMAEGCRKLEMLGKADSVAGTIQQPSRRPAALVDRLAWEVNRARWMLKRLGINGLPGQPRP